MTTPTEADVEAAALSWLAGLGWQVAHGPGIAPDAPGAERGGYGQVVPEGRLRDALPPKLVSGEVGVEETNIADRMPTE